MSKYDQEYYIAYTTLNPDQLHIKPKASTAARGYRYTKLTLGEAPLFFVNAFQKRDQKTGARRTVTDILYDGASFAVTDEIKRYLGQFEIASMQHYPAIIINDDDRWHEDYWYLNIYERLDCWDRNTSIYEIDTEANDPKPMVDKFSLDTAKLEAIPEEKRLIFKIGGASKAYVLMHRKIVKHILENAYTGIRFFKVADFEEGDQNF